MKTLAFFGFLLAVSGLAFFAVSFAQEEPAPQKPPVVLPEGPQRPGEIIAIIQNITDWIFTIFLAVAVIMVILAAFQFLTGPEGAAAARQKLVFVVVGVAIALLARSFVPIVRQILGV